MNDVERALLQISDIRTQLAASTRFRGYAPEVLVGSVLLIFLVMLAQAAWPERFAASDVQQVWLWGTVLGLSCLAVDVDAVSRSRWKHGGMAPAMLRIAMLSQLPVAAAGIIIAVAICRFSPQTARIVPGIWLLLIGLVAFLSLAILSRRIVWAGVWYGLSGTLAIMLAGQAGRFSGWMMGLPLVVGHLFIARILWLDGSEAGD